MNQRFAILALSAALTLGLYAAARGQSGSITAPATATATVDFNRVLRECKQQASLLAENATKSLELNNENTARTQEIKRLQAEMDPLQPGGTAWQDKARIVRQKQLELEVWGKLAQQDNQLTRARQLAKLYTAINGATAAVAAEQGYDLVVMSETLPDLLSVNVQRLEAIMQTRKVIYTGPNTDITDAVLQRVDTDYAGR